jgi:hypothetical protein
MMTLSNFLQDAIKDQNIKLSDSMNLFKLIEIQYLTVNLNAQMLVKSYSFTSSSSYCKFMSHVRFVSSLSSFWIDLCENDTVFWVNDLKDVNCRFWIDRRAVILSFSGNSSRSTALWKDEIDDDDDILLRNVISRSNLLTSLTSWISMLERIFNSCQKARFSAFFSV